MKKLLILCLLSSSAMSQTAAVLKRSGNNELTGPLAVSGTNDITALPDPTIYGAFGFPNSNDGSPNLINRLRTIYSRQRHLQFVLTPPASGQWTDVILKCLKTTDAPFLPSGAANYGVFIATADRPATALTAQTDSYNYRVEVWTAVTPLNDSRQRWVHAEGDPNPIGYYVGDGKPWNYLTGMRITFGWNSGASFWDASQTYWVVLWTNSTSVYQIGGQDAWIPVQPISVPTYPVIFNGGAEDWDGQPRLSDPAPSP